VNRTRDHCPTSIHSETFAANVYFDALTVPLPNNNFLTVCDNVIAVDKTMFQAGSHIGAER
jgi:hypothetical protein